MRKRKTHSSPTIPRIAIHDLGADHIALPSTPKDPPNGRGFKAIQRFSALSIQVPFVIVINELGVVYKDDNGRWLDADLVAIVNLGLTAVSSRRWGLPEHGIPKYFIKNGRTDPLPVRLNGLVNDIVDLAHSLSGGG